jgi:hypothetical protein
VPNAKESLQLKIAAFPKNTSFLSPHISQFNFQGISFPTFLKRFVKFMQKGKTLHL